MKMLFRKSKNFYFPVSCLLFIAFFSANCGRKNVDVMPPKQSLEIATPTTTPNSSNQKNNDQNMNQSTTISPGNWGATGIALAVEENGVKIEFDCAVGEINEKLNVGENGEFTANGLYTPESFGPIREDNPPKPKPARYEGKISGDKMTLNVILPETKEKIGIFTLERGKFARLRKCQ